MKQLLSFLMVFLLFSCVEAQLDDLEIFVADSKSKPYLFNDNVPTLKKINPLIYIQTDLRNPFSMPQVAQVTEVNRLPTSCYQADLKSKNKILAMYSLSSIKMRGSLSNNGEIWALVQAPDSQVYKVQAGDYLGLNNSNVLKVSSTQIDLLELVSDSNDCWQERMAQLNLQSQ